MFTNAGGTFGGIVKPKPGVVRRLEGEDRGSVMEEGRFRSGPPGLGNGVSPEVCVPKASLLCLLSVGKTPLCEEA
jgi:hypothetical protein